MNTQFEYQAPTSRKLGALIRDCARHALGNWPRWHCFGRVAERLDSRWLVVGARAVASVIVGLEVAADSVRLHSHLVDSVAARLRAVCARRFGRQRLLEAAPEHRVFLHINQ